MGTFGRVLTQNTAGAFFFEMYCQQIPPSLAAGLHIVAWHHLRESEGWSSCVGH